MTPIEIMEYKQRWMSEGGYAVTLHSDLRSQGVDWCKLWLNPIHWKHAKHTNVYEDTFYFEKASHAKGLIEKFPEYTNMNN